MPKSFAIVPENLDFPASLCFDGDYTNYCQDSSSEGSTLTVTLYGTVKAIIIYNRLGSQAVMRLGIGLTITLDDVVIGTISESGDWTRQIFTVNGVDFGAHVVVIQSTTHLNLAEVEIYGSAIAPTTETQPHTIIIPGIQYTCCYRFSIENLIFLCTV